MITNSELKEFKHLKNIIKLKEQEIENLRSTAEYGSTGVGQPCGKRTANKSRQEKYYEEAEELIRQLEEDRATLLDREMKIRRFIEMIDDEFVKAVFTYRSLYGYTWSQVATALGNNNSPDNLLMIYFRYLNKHKEDV